MWQKILIQMGVQFVFKKLRERAMTKLKGKLTYTGVGVAGLIALAKFFDFPLSETDAVEVVQAVAIVVAAFGNWRAKRNYQ